MPANGDVHGDVMCRESFLLHSIQKKERNCKHMKETYHFPYL